MAIGSKDLTAGNLRGFDDDRLVDELRKAKEELFNLRFQSATEVLGQLFVDARRTAQRRVEGPGEVSRGGPVGVGTLAHGEPSLGGQDHPFDEVLGPVRDPAPDDLL